MKYKVTLTKQLYYEEIEVVANNTEEAMQKAKDVIEDEELQPKSSSWNCMTEGA